MPTRRQLVGGGLGLLCGAWLERFARAAPAAAPAPRAKHVIVLWMNGGPSHIDTWDPKTGPTGGRHKSIATNVPGIRISEHLPLLAQRANKLAIVRGMTSKEGNHVRAQYLVHTGYAPNPTVQHPAFGAWMSKELGEPASGLPSFVSLNGASAGGGFFGVEHGPFVVRAGGELPADTTLPADVDEARYRARQRLLGDLDGAFAERTGDAKVVGRRALYTKADRLMHASALSAFDVGKEPAATLKAFGEGGFGRACLTAVRLVGAGVRYVEVTLDGWDTHKDGFERTKKLMGQLDPAMSALLAELEHRELLKDTLVVCLGEFGRTPRINGDEGRDHWPGAWSAVLAGAGIRTGITVGETDAEGARVVRDPVTVPNLLATLATPLGLNPDETVMSPVGRPISLTDGGQPVRSLLLG